MQVVSERTAMYVIGVFIIYYLPMAYCTEQYSYVVNNDDVRTLCEHGAFCTSEPAQFLLGRQRVTCCKTCSCARDCHMTGSCCPDAEFNRPTKASLLSIVQYLNLNRNLTHMPSAIFKTQIPERFRIVNRCPAGYNDVHVSQLCENPKELDDYSIVSGVTGITMFGNKHCAICHGVKESVLWGLFAYDCDSLFQRRVSFTSFEDRDNFVMKNCKLIALPREDQTQRCLHVQTYLLNEKGGCSLNLIWKDSKDFLYQNCSSYMAGERLLRTAYNNNVTSLEFVNPACFSCNGRAVSPVNDENTCRHLEAGPLIALDKNYNVSESAEQRCPHTHQVFDHKTNQCRAVYCSAGSIPNNGRCVFPFSHIEGASLEVFFKIAFSDPVDKQPRFVLHASVLNKVEREIHARSMPKCQFCVSELLKTNSNKVFFLKAVIKSSESCRFGDLVYVLNKMTTENIAHNVTLYGVAKEVLISPIIDTFPNTVSVLSLLNGMDSNNKCDAAPLRFDSSFGGFSCPKIEITLSELKQLGINGTDMRELVGKYFEMSTSPEGEHQSEAFQTVTLCVRDYFKVVNAQKVQARNLPAYPIVTSGQEGMYSDVAYVLLFAVFFVLSYYKYV